MITETSPPLSNRKNDLKRKQLFSLFPRPILPSIPHINTLHCIISPHNPLSMLRRDIPPEPTVSHLDLQYCKTTRTSRKSCLAFKSEKFMPSKPPSVAQVQAFKMKFIPPPRGYLYCLYTLCLAPLSSKGRSSKQTLH